LSENSKIEWTDHTFNPWEGCQKVSPGCDHCYAESRNARFGGGVAINWGPGAPRRRTSPANWRKPLQWNANHEVFFAEHGHRQRVFCASLADVFDNQVPDDWREDLFELIRTTPNLDWLLLTKRPQNIIRMVREHGAVAGNGTRYLPGNAWLGTTTEDQPRADQNIPALLRTIGELGARVTFLSVEPMLGPIEVFSEITGELLHTSGNDFEPGWINWVICGGESGHGARPMHPGWPRALRDQCAAAGVPFLFKQWGEWTDEDWGERAGLRDTAGVLPSGEFLLATEGYVPPFDDGARLAAAGNVRLDGRMLMDRVGKKAAGRELDGRTHDEFPRGRE
jgi:protein gp37